jgi:solute carrier family 35 protein E1
LNVLPAPLIVGTIQFGIGALYCALVWLLRLRPFPVLTKDGKDAVAKVGFYHATGQLASMISLGAGPVSFTHIVKAMEPFFSAVVSGFYFQKWMPYQVYLTLIPVVSFYEMRFGCDAKFTNYDKTLNNNRSFRFLRRSVELVMPA